MKETVDKQNETMAEMMQKLNELLIKNTKLKLGSEKNAKEIIRVSQTKEDDQESTGRVFEELSAVDSRIDEEMVQQKVQLSIY